jgi:hypothetical protein
MGFLILDTLFYAAISYGGFKVAQHYRVWMKMPSRAG